MSKDKFSEANSIAERFVWALDQIKAETGLKQKEIATQIGVHPASLSQIKSGSSKRPSLQTQLLLRNQFGINPHWLQTGQGSPRLPLPAAEAVSTDYLEVPWLLPNGELATDKPPLRFLTHWVMTNLKTQPELLRLVEVSGKALEPQLCDGDAALCDLGRTYVQPGRYYLLQLKTGLNIKQLQLNLAGEALAQGEGPLPPDCKILGQVRWRGGEL